MSTFSVRNWDTYQHYKPEAGKLPTWLKLHLSITSHIAWIKGSNLARLLMIGAILLAGRYKNSIEIDEDIVSRSLGLRDKWPDVLLELKYLSSREFIEINDAGSSLTRADARSPEEELDSELDPLKPPKGAGKYTEEFLRFWEAYPHKVGKDAAWKAWQKRTDRPLSETIIVAVLNYARTKPADREWCNPAKWLNQGRWDDAPAAASSAEIPLNSTAANPERAQWLMRCEGFVKSVNNYWNRDQWGPAPNEQGCKAPADVVSETSAANVTPTFLKRERAVA